MAATIAYSTSLTNASGKTIDPEVIVMTDELGSKPQTKHANFRQLKEVKTQPNSGRTKKQTGPKKSIKKGGKELCLESAQAVQEKKDLSKAKDALRSWEQ